MCWGVIGGMIVSRCLVVVKRKTCLLIVSIEAWHIEAWHETIVCIISHVSNKLINGIYMELKKNVAWFDTEKISTGKISKIGRAHV